jgi:Skp family chaperone for outer membrane proteins
MTTPSTALSRSIIAASLFVALGAAAMSTRALSPAPQAPASAPVRIATVDTLAVVERLVLSEKFAPARDALAADKNKAMEPLAKALDDFEARAKLLQPGAPELKPLQEQYQQTQRQLDQMAEAARREVEALNVKQISDAFKTVNESAGAMADKLGYTHVLSSRGGEPALRSSTVNLAVQEMIARGVVKAPAEDDLTQRLFDELGIANVVVPSTTPAQTPAPESK